MEKSQIDAKEIQKKLVEMNLLENQLGQLDQQFALLEKHISELQVLDISIEELSKTRKDQEFFAPIGNEIFVRSRIIEPEEVLINIGGKTMIKKKTAEAKKLIEERIAHANEIKDQVSEEMQLILNEMQGIQQEVILYQQGHVYDENCNHGH